MKRALLSFSLIALIFFSPANAQDDGGERTCDDETVNNTLEWAIERFEEALTADPATQHAAIVEVRSELAALESACFSSDSTIPDYAPAFGIDYSHPEQYLAQGAQSQISDPSILDGLRAEEQSMAHLEEIFRWLKSEFTAYSAGGKTIGVVTVDQLLSERRLGGCHDHALVYAAVARELGYPAIMARTVSIAWANQFQIGEYDRYVGHVFVEVYLDGKWVLIDSTNGYYVEDGYDPSNPVIPLTGNIAGTTEEIYGFLVERKGIDTWGFGIHSPAESNEAMKEFAGQIDLAAIEYPDYVFQRFAPRRRR